MIAGAVALLSALGWSTVGLLFYGGEMTPNLVAELAGVSLEVGIAALIVERLMTRHQRWQWDFAYRAFAKRASEVFVDVMRLLFVRSSDGPLQVNHPRYAYFVRLAHQHLAELRSHIEGSATALDSDTHEKYRRVERRLSWCIAQMQDVPTSPDYQRNLYTLLSETATVIFDLLLQADGKNQAFLVIARSCVSKASSMRREDAKQVGIFLDRSDAQTLMLKELVPERRPISSIVQDVDCDYSIPYFMIDYLLLTREEDAPSS
ncbi:hypothetical protein Airi02_040670 [Actinoallomurus iriomotensis]|uniref:Uncharacterized protein n=1 Tax=Actinoallomurus iriomotensis TaxID=478107 RepID=A0A9W6VUZ3_9ACTN|nr:hypothetical protein Airi02_040670 [Actinoallomurus iriomotensis]